MVTENVSKLLDEVKKLSIEEQSSLLLETIKKFTLLDVKNLTDNFCQTFGVTANAPVAIGTGPAVQAAEEKKDEPTEFEVVLKDAGDKKVQVIKAVRAITNLGLKEAKSLVETAPQPVKGGVTKEESEKIKKELEEAGGVVEVKGM